MKKINDKIFIERITKKIIEIRNDHLSKINHFAETLDEDDYCKKIVENLNSDYMLFATASKEMMVNTYVDQVISQIILFFSNFLDHSFQYKEKHNFIFQELIHMNNKYAFLVDALEATLNIKSSYGLNGVNWKERLKEIKESDAQAFRGRVKDFCLKCPYISFQKPKTITGKDKEELQECLRLISKLKSERRFPESLSTLEESLREHCLQLDQVKDLNTYFYSSEEAPIDWFNETYRQLNILCNTFDVRCSDLKHSQRKVEDFYYESSPEWMKVKELLDDNIYTATMREDRYWIDQFFNAETDRVCNDYPNEMSMFIGNMYKSRLSEIELKILMLQLSAEKDKEVLSDEVLATSWVPTFDRWFVEYEESIKLVLDSAEFLNILSEDYEAFTVGGEGQELKMIVFLSEKTIEIMPFLKNRLNLALILKKGIDLSIATVKLSQGEVSGYVDLAHLGMEGYSTREKVKLLKEIKKNMITSINEIRQTSDFISQETAKIKP